MTTILCTLYNSLYLDKGLVLYDSLCECAKDFKLYVLCMDDKCYDVLTDLNQPNHIPVRLSDFEEGDKALLNAKANRPMGEYCWTCSSSFIRYVLKHYKENICTYIDADMYFYSEPQVLVDEMLSAGKSAMVIPHGFHEGNKHIADRVGAYCVEFNTFRNNEEGLRILEYWRNRCLDCCSNIDDGIHWGDQKYLEELVREFDGVHVCMNKGAGIAPWNIKQYIPQNKQGMLLYIPNNKPVKIVFFHYQSITYIDDNTVDIGFSKSDDKRYIELLYKPYLLKIKDKKIMLAQSFGIHALIQSHPSINKEERWFDHTFIGKFILSLRRKKDQKVLVKL